MIDSKFVSIIILLIILFLFFNSGQIIEKFEKPPLVTDLFCQYPNDQVSIPYVYEKLTGRILDDIEIGSNYYRMYRNYPYLYYWDPKSYRYNWYPWQNDQNPKIADYP